MNESLHPASEQWIATINGQLVAHVGIIQFPMRKGWKRVHRLVVLPDFQGIGIGTRFINEITKIYIAEGWKMNLTTTTPALVHALVKDKNWLLFRKDRCKTTWANFKKYNTNVGNGVKGMEALAKSASVNRITYSFNWK